jgi:inactivated superfamily I helicase
MSNPSIEAYKNSSDNVVLVYISSLGDGQPVNSQWIEIDANHVGEAVKQLNKFKKESE